MGFWGTFVVHHGERALGELLPHIAEFGEAELCAGGAPGGWQVTRVFCSLDELTEGFLAGLRDLTAAPVLAADVLDSDAAFVTALGVQTGPWQTWLNLDAAMGYLVTPPAPFDENDNYLGDDWVDPEYEREIAALKERILAESPGGEVAAARAIAWALDGGLDPGAADEVVAALGSDEGFVEDQFFALIGRLGLPA